MTTQKSGRGRKRNVAEQSVAGTVARQVGIVHWHSAVEADVREIKDQLTSLIRRRDLLFWLQLSVAILTLLVAGAVALAGVSAAFSIASGGGIAVLKHLDSQVRADIIEVRRELEREKRMARTAGLAIATDASGSGSPNVQALASNMIEQVESGPEREPAQLEVGPKRSLRPNSKSSGRPRSRS
jgi:GAF domain-containing protein